MSARAEWILLAAILLTAALASAYADPPPSKTPAPTSSVPAAPAPSVPVPNTVPAPAANPTATTPVDATTAVPLITHPGPWGKLLTASETLDAPLEFSGRPALGQPRRVIRLVLSQWFTNCYILVGKTNQAIVIDPADLLKPVPGNGWDLTGQDTATLLDTLKKNHLDVRYIVCTHGHLDHVSGAPAVEAAYHCVLCMNPNDVDADGRPKDSHMFPHPLPRVDRLLRQGDTVTCDGIQLKVLATPGHSRGSICLRTGDWVFSGDTLFWHTVGRTNFLDGSGDWDMEMRSIRSKLYPLPDATLVLPGHFQFTTIGEEKASNPWTQAGAPNPAP